MGATAKKTLRAAVLAAGVTIAGRHGVDTDGVGRVVKCETRAITRVAKQLRDAGSSSSPGAGRRQLRALRRLGECDRQRRSAPARHDRPQR